MLLSAITYNRAVSNYGKENVREYFRTGSFTSDLGAVAGVDLALVALIMLVEIALVIWALVLAVRCAKNTGGGALRYVIHILLALFFPLIYIIVALITGCGKKGRR